MTDLRSIDAPCVRPTVGDLRRARDLLLAAGNASAENVARALGTILYGGDPVVALGLKASAGRRSALTVDRIASRDDLLRSMAARHYAGLCVSAQARSIANAAEAYWRRAAAADANLDDMPGSYAGMPREFLFHIARLPATVPSERTIRAVLST